MKKGWFKHAFHIEPEDTIEPTELQKKPLMRSAAVSFVAA